MHHPCGGDKLVYSAAMKKLCVLMLLALVGLAVTGCRSSHSGSREYLPGKGWQHTD
jgi:hypothetical protein